MLMDEADFEVPQNNQADFDEENHIIHIGMALTPQFHFDPRLLNTSPKSPEDKVPIQTAHLDTWEKFFKPDHNSKLT